MAGLPQMVNADRITGRKQVKFGGYNHTAAADNGELWDMKNLTSDYYPLLSPRERRWVYTTIQKPNGFLAHDGLFWADGTGFYADGTLKGSVTDTKKTFASLGAYIIILPDKKYYNRLTGEFGSMEASRSGPAKLQDGSYAGESAAANTIYAKDADWGSSFREGDGVTISGCTRHTENNKTVIIREIDGDYLRFYENTFVIDDGGDSETIQITRSMPDLDFICENENRLWGCKNDTIYASKLGDIFNWNVYDGVSTDSFTVDVGSTGDFTACASYLGYPCFFKEEHVYKVYGDKPSNFQVMGSASSGVEKGSDRSLAIAGEVMFYLSRAGIVAWSGGIPQSIAAPFGMQRFKNAVAGSDGTKYYVSMQGKNGYELFVYDTRVKLWHKEDDTEVIGWGWNEELYFLDSSGRIQISGNARSVPAASVREASVQWMAEWADFYGYTSYSSSSSETPEKKTVSKLLIRLELDEGASLKIEMQFDSDGIWQTVKELNAEKKRSYYLPIIPRRCDHFRIRMSGQGECRLYSLVREVYTGSPN